MATIQTWNLISQSIPTIGFNEMTDYPKKSKIAPICCNKDAKWVVNSPTLQYWYCGECKNEVSSDLTILRKSAKEELQDIVLQTPPWYKNPYSKFFTAVESLLSYGYAIACHDTSELFDLHQGTFYKGTLQIVYVGSSSFAKGDEAEIVHGNLVKVKKDPAPGDLVARDGQGNLVVVDPSRLPVTGNIVFPRT